MSSDIQDQAHSIMGKNFFGIDEAFHYFGIRPSKEELIHLAEIPWNEKVLKSCRDTHILVAAFPISILDIRDKAGRELYREFENTWYSRKCAEVFVNKKGEASWQLIRKTPVVGSTDKSWLEQQKLLGSDEETPTARILFYTIIGHFLVTGERLFENVSVWCSDLDSSGYCSRFGWYSTGPIVDTAWHTYEAVRGPGMGLSSVRIKRER
ncbi:MAG: hypothetical protein AAB706_02685 [Patescibacteria group bacterium]